MESSPELTLWMPDEELPPEIIDEFPTLEAIPVVLQLFLEVKGEPTPYQVQRAVAIINQRRMDVVEDYKNGYYPVRPLTEPTSQAKGEENGK